jgi:hypothetical protein
MADTLLEQFLVHECTPQVRHSIANAADDASVLRLRQLHREMPARKAQLGGPVWV